MQHHLITTELRCELSRSFPIAHGDIDLLRYRLKPLPSKYGGPQEALLIFEDDMTKGHSDAKHEGQIILSFLSLMFDCRVRETGYRVNGLDIGGNGPKNAHLSELFEGLLPTENSAKMIDHLFTLGDQLSKQYARACNAYSLAIVSVDFDRSLAFLLLVTALECMSTQEEFHPNTELDKSQKSVERYCLFVKTYCVDVQQHYPEGGEEAFTRDLKTIYYSHRSGFAHGGKEVSIASEIADQSGRNSIGHFVGGKEVFTPSLKWFFKVARSTLIGFLLNSPRSPQAPNHEVFANIARAKSTLTVRVE